MQGHIMTIPMKLKTNIGKKKDEKNFLDSVRSMISLVLLHAPKP